MKRILLLLLFPIIGYSQTLDTSFDGDGILKYQTSDTPTPQRTYDVAVQADGKIVHIGQSGFYGITSFIARFNTDGSLDSSFNVLGFKFYTTPPFQSLFIQNDNKIVVAGGNTISRILPNGDFDTSFNTTGSLKIDFNNQGMIIRKISVQTDNSIIVSGSIMNGVTYDFAVAKLHSNGNLDTSFDSDGIAIIEVGTGIDRSYAHKVLADGKIIILGDSHNGTVVDFALAKINSDGSLDTTFGNNGKVINTAATVISYGRDLEILPDGKILALGNSASKLFLAQYLPNGTLDTTFDGDGKFILNHVIQMNSAVTPAFPNPLSRLKVLSDGKILISGSYSNTFKVIKLLSDGTTYDTSFGTGGVAVINDTNNAYSSFLIPKSDGTILTGGFSTEYEYQYNRIKHIELNTNGGVISNTTKNLYLSYENSMSTLIDENDQSLYVLTASELSNHANYTMIVIKFLANGTRDMAYGNSGYAILGDTSTPNSKMYKLADGKLVIAQDTYLYKLTTAGILDNTFGFEGILDLNELTEYTLTDIDNFIISNDNKMLIAFDYASQLPSSQYTYSFGVLKLNLDGTFDTNFGTNGIVSHRFNPDLDNYYEFPTSLSQDNDGKIIAVGPSYLKSQQSTNTKICSLRLNSDGSIDYSYGTSGEYVFNSSFSIFPQSIIKTTDNQYLVDFHSFSTTGDVYNSYTTYTLKMNYDGSIDNSFGTNGIASDIVGTSNKSMVLQSDGKIVKVGQKNDHCSISRYLSNGAVDSTFGNNGILNTIVGDSSNIFSVLFQSDNKLLVNGYCFVGDRKLSLIARYTDLNLGTVDFSSDKNALLVYPNPIENEATFEYTLKNNENITVEIVDIQGRVIKKIIVNEYQNTGKQTLSFSLEGVSSGTYILKINSKKGSQSVRLLKK